MKSYLLSVKVFEIEYNHEKWNIEIIKQPENPDDLFEIWLYPNNYGIKEMIVGEYRNGRNDQEVYEDLINYLYIKWENPEDHISRNCFENFMLDHKEDF